VGTRAKSEIPTAIQRISVRNDRTPTGQGASLFSSITHTQREIESPELKGLKELRNQCINVYKRWIFPFITGKGAIPRNTYLSKLAEELDALRKVPRSIALGESVPFSQIALKVADHGPVCLDDPVLACDSALMGGVRQESGLVDRPR